MPQALTGSTSTGPLTPTPPLPLTPNPSPLSPLSLTPPPPPGTGSFGYTHARPTLHADPVPTVSDVRAAAESEHPIARLVTHGAHNPLLALDGRTQFISRSQGEAMWRLATQQ
jgi:hypothetical protein